MTPYIETFPATGGMVRARLDGVPFTAELIRALPVRAVARPDLLDATPLLSVTTSRVYAWTSLEAGRRTTITSPAVGEWIATDSAGRLVLVVALWVLRVKGAILISILVTTVVAVVVEALGGFGQGGAKNPTGWALTVPTLPGNVFDTPDFGTLGQFNLLGSFTEVGVVWQDLEERVLVAIRSDDQNASAG